MGAPPPKVLTSAAPCVQVKLKQVGFEVPKKRKKKDRAYVSNLTHTDINRLGDHFTKIPKRIKNVSRIMTKNATKKDLREVG